MNAEERIAGAILGAALGDALGVPVEFVSRVKLSAAPVEGMRGWGTHGQPAGTWSDDTSMTLCVLESILNTGWNLTDQGSRFVRWLRKAHLTANDEVFDFGGATAAAIRAIEAGASPSESGGRGEYDNGNGSLMRNIAAALYFSDAPDSILAGAVLGSGALTHAHPRSRLACVIHGLVASALVKGAPPRGAIEQAATRLTALMEGQSSVADLAAERPHFNRMLSGGLAEVPEQDIRGDGYVVRSLEAALWCLVRSTSFEDCVLKAVNLGEDTDTTAAVAGGLAGLYWGRKSIPAAWVSGLAKADLISSMAEAVAELVRVPLPFPESYWILPGKFLAGEYPRTLVESTSRAKLDSLLGAGITSTVDLTEPGETSSGRSLLPYADLYAGRAAARGRRVTVHHVAMTDGRAPTGVSVRAALDAVRSVLNRGEAVYVHCWGGLGRTGVVVGAWLIESGFATPATVEAVIRDLRRSCPGRDARSPETEAQLALLRGWGG